MPSKLEQLQQQYRRQLLQEKEERMIKIHTDNQQKALSKISKYNVIQSVSVIKPPSTFAAPQPHHSPIKKGSPGVDRSRPLPPIAKEQRNPCVQNNSGSISHQYAFQSTRSSPVSVPVETVSKSANASSRSRSMDLDARHSPSRVGAANGRTPLKNGHSRTSEQESKTEPSKDLLHSRLKQAELQRMKANKARDETTTKNGFSSIAAKSSITQKKTTPSRSSPTATNALPSRPNPKPQVSSYPARKPRAAPASSPRKPAQQGQLKPPGPGQEQCRVCGRNFNSDRIEKHVSICQKAAQKKIKVFDATKMRVKGTEAEQFVKKGLPKTEPKAKKSDWRKKHNDFIEAIRQAKVVQQHLAKGGKVSDLPPPPPSDTSDYTPCPHCGRKFNDAVAERHIPKCKNILSNKKNPAAARRK